MQGMSKTFVITTIAANQNEGEYHKEPIRSLIIIKKKNDLSEARENAGEPSRT